MDSVPSENWAAPQAADTSTRFTILAILSSILSLSVSRTHTHTPAKGKHFFHCFIGYKRGNAEEIFLECGWREVRCSVFRFLKR